MAKREKTTKAVYYSMRLNPVTSREDKDTLDIIRELEGKGFTFKQVAQDAILRASGATPEMYTRFGSGNLIGSIEDLLSRFMGEILSEVRKGGIRVQDSDDNIEIDGDVSPFTKNFARSFMQRQQRSDEDDE